MKQKRADLPPAKPGRPRKLDAGRRVNVYLDTASIEAARKDGNGSISEGIRKAIKAKTSV